MLCTSATGIYQINRCNVMCCMQDVCVPDSQKEPGETVQKNIGSESDCLYGNEV